MRDYLATHERLANELGKPLLFEEFGFPRDGESYAPEATTEFRDRYYRLIYGAVEASWESGGPIMGSNFWAWNGEARAAHADSRFAEGDRAYMGDPPHEPQGWYGLFDGDSSTLAIVREHAAKALPGSCGAMRDRLTHPTRREALAGLAALSLAGAAAAARLAAGGSTPTPAPTPAPTPSATVAEPQRARRANAAAAGAARSPGTPGRDRRLDPEPGLRRDRQGRMRRGRARERAEVAADPPGPDTFDFARMDQIVAWAQAQRPRDPRPHAAVAPAALVPDLAQQLRLRRQSARPRPSGC